MLLNITPMVLLTLAMTHVTGPVVWANPISIANSDSLETTQHILDLANHVQDNQHGDVQITDDDRPVKYIVVKKLTPVTVANSTANVEEVVDVFQVDG
ncbi:hypothetical protein BASA50_010619 [Batrachochytrium salamandrivorans]|uniref:Uncharacterized protein n=1 Tax=Batrachochytrium salamandrivorans TaxID=1357716 RepID=A0ABQ8EY57_9FUNG|nr:hypothetical protein BASA62_004010 [Batrachochytrium salamandrivorans]KAH6588657.1 hypothetical protein BASA50_010619 [Batrachochytrium salamandrivorans]KAH9269310.1 hypothetical protein BASA83_008672 [Batrachochytrium salamandrivorans]